MITNNILTRKMGDLEVYQRTSDGYFDGNHLAYLFNKQSGNRYRYVYDYLRLKRTKRFLSSLNIYFEGLHAAKKIQLYYKIIGAVTKYGKERDEIWMHPYIFMDFSMWLNPEFKVSVVKFVSKDMIDTYDSISESLDKLTETMAKIFPNDNVLGSVEKVNKAINIAIYGDTSQGKHDPFEEVRNLNRAIELRRELSNLINLGYIKDSKGLNEYFHKIFQREKVLPF